MTDTTVSFISATPCYASPRFSLSEERFSTPDGEVSRPVIHHPGAVAVIAQPDAGHLLLVRQYRYPVRRWTLEIPAGTRAPGEAPERTAARELREEAGQQARTLTEMVRFFPALGVSDEELIIYRADGLSEVPPAPEHGELVSRVVVALSELPAMVASGALCDAKTLIAMALLGIALPARGPAPVQPPAAGAGGG
jgi:ADP-ribose pyrophosphatase